MLVVKFVRRDLTTNTCASNTYYLVSLPCLQAVRVPDFYFVDVDRLSDLSRLERPGFFPSNHQRLLRTRFDEYRRRNPPGIADQRTTIARENPLKDDRQ